MTFILKVTLFFIGFLKAKFRCFFINIMEFCENFVFIDTLLSFENEACNAFIDFLLQESEILFHWCFTLKGGFFKIFYF